MQRDRIFEITIHGFPGVQRIRAANKRQAQYRSWQHAKEAGYRVTLIQFVREWVERVEPETVWSN